MRGTVFVEFVSHLEERFGLEEVDSVIEELRETLSTQGAYTTVGNYPHGELLAIATHVCEHTDTSIENLIGEFARFLLQAFHSMHPEYFTNADDLMQFLDSIEQLIHKDVRKLYSDAVPPDVHLERHEDGSATLHYSSHRPMAPLAHALVLASSEMFNEPVDIESVDTTEEGRRMALRMRV